MSLSISSLFTSSSDIAASAALGELSTLLFSIATSSTLAGTESLLLSSCSTMAGADATGEDAESLSVESCTGFLPIMIENGLCRCCWDDEYDDDDDPRTVPPLETDRFDDFESFGVLFEDGGRAGVVASSGEEDELLLDEADVG